MRLLFVGALALGGCVARPLVHTPRAVCTGAVAEPRETRTGDVPRTSRGATDERLERRLGTMSAVLGEHVVARDVMRTFLAARGAEAFPSTVEAGECLTAVVETTSGLRRLVVTIFDEEGIAIARSVERDLAPSVCVTTATTLWSVLEVEDGAGPIALGLLRTSAEAAPELAHLVGRAPVVVGPRGELDERIAARGFVLVEHDAVALDDAQAMRVPVAIRAGTCVAVAWSVDGEADASVRWVDVAGSELDAERTTSFAIRCETAAVERAIELAAPRATTVRLWLMSTTP